MPDNNNKMSFDDAGFFVKAINKAKDEAVSDVFALANILIRQGVIDEQEYREERLKMKKEFEEHRKKENES
ncbi:hypothetical protein [Salinibacillus xinjiangensis]|uniref:Uncharacterized protein n=1 Tax=Salinibacillus xinjiangensis TaxID=1229268 RepID=A0A6G1X7N3_9BACI|nr:hypothetical protein [Salinibacillus xinjiangensis]MRG87013.1 hypothetical protein [Salinibacillus xinjiangensis]